LAGRAQAGEEKARRKIRARAKRFIMITIAHRGRRLKGGSDYATRPPYSCREHLWSN
jgi:hypothetical protein